MNVKANGNVPAQDISGTGTSPDFVRAEGAHRAVRMHHFLPEVDLEAEYPFCTRNWVG